MDFTSLPKGRRILPIIQSDLSGYRATYCHSPRSALVHLPPPQSRRPIYPRDLYSSHLPVLRLRHVYISVHLLRWAATLLHNLLCSIAVSAISFRSSPHIFISSTLHLNSSPGPYGLKQPLSVSLIESEVLRCSLGSLCSVDRDILLYNLWFVN